MAVEAWHEHGHPRGGTSWRVAGMHAGVSVSQQHTLPKVSTLSSRWKDC